MRAILLAACAHLVLASALAHASEEDPPVAVVNGHVVRLSHVYAEIEDLPLGEQITYHENLERLVDSVVHEEVIYQSMRASDFAAEPALRAQVRAAVVRYLIERHVKARIDVTDAAVAEFYDANQSAIRAETVDVSLIERPLRSECEALGEAIHSHESFRTAVRERSTDRESAERGGFIGSFMNHPGQLGFEEALFDLAPGDLAVFDVPDGCVLVRVDARTTPPLPALDSVAAQIRAHLEREQESALLRALIERSSGGIEVERLALPPG